MSINSMTTEELNGLALRGIDLTTDEQSKDQDNQRTGSNALAVLIKYIPTEIITLYIAAVAALETSQMRSEIFYWFFVTFTPICYWLVFIGKCRENRMKVLPKLSLWPWWGMFASTVAFGVWALALPSAPYVDREATALAGLGALFISTLLSLLEPIVRDFLPA